MFREDNDSVFINSYYDSGAEKRLGMLLDHYSSFPGFIRTLQFQTTYKIDAEFDSMNADSAELLGVRVQTSGLANITESKGMRLAELTKAFDTGVVDRDLLKGIEDAENYRMEIWVIYSMKKDYELVDGVIKNLDENDYPFYSEYLKRKRELKALADEYGMEYETARKRIARIRRQIKNSTLCCMMKRCKK